MEYTETDRADLLKIKDIHAQVFAKAESGGNGETAEHHTTTHYIWRTRHDGKVRPEHAANDGKVFAWNDPPPTGHPGEDFGCRCWAEPLRAESELKEHVSQSVTYSAPDAPHAWTWKDFSAHYRSGLGKDVTLHEIGLLQRVIKHAQTFNQSHLPGGGSLFERVERQIFSKARQTGSDEFSDTFKGGKYSFHDVVWPLGHVPIHGSMNVHVIEKSGFLIISAEIVYNFADYFRVESLNGESEGEETHSPMDRGLSIIGTKAYYIIDTWNTHLEAIIRKESEAKNKYLQI